VPRISLVSVDSSVLIESTMPLSQSNEEQMTTKQKMLLAFSLRGQYLQTIGALQEMAVSLS